jgi:hypothetical protein
MNQTAIRVDQTIMTLTEEERERLFRIITDNIDIFKKVIPDSPLLAFIAGDSSTMGDAQNHPMVQHLVQWQSTQND